MTTVSRETEVRLQHYKALLQKWNARINLVSAKSLDGIDSRHIADSLQLMDLASPPAKWVDLGSGGGLPGLVIAIALQDTETDFTLIESDQRKAAFLRTVIRELGLQNVDVLPARIEEAQPQRAQIISARALAALDVLMPWINRHIAEDGLALLLKGRGWRAEIEAAQEHWQFQYTAVPSKTDPEAVVLKISGVSDA
ncbi:16S rRNA (guanine(527)-N(7))-methyltransferase RsmG [Paracoccus tibetensis]|uniref:Ribosomal RNA small subunit methyltransferase G n=1 Tax=Paracoccus tibetensis TaxID=336292 RepID=A0A1G5EH88_9RHOB|nr:16S rRNA (guanine(527)-N(7))-methyltransferase RsmG [Paracoccus tibetensis]SCY26060.1 16S rRNA m(7)G-527 methyltransferase [Paracoccus tibetensis]